MASSRTKLFPLALAATFLFFVGGIVASSSSFAQVPQGESIVFLGDSSYAPYEYLVDGKPVGANVDLLNAIGEVLERPIEIRLMKWAEAQEKIARGEGHALTFMSRNEKRDKLYDFTEFTFSPGFFFFVQSNNSSTFDHKKLGEMRIGVVKGGFPEAFLEENHPEATLVQMATDLHGFTSLLSETIDAVATSELTGSHVLRENAISGIEIVADPFAIKTAGIAVPKGNPELVQQLNRAIQTVKQSRKFDDILIKWFGRPKTPIEHRDYPVFWLVGAAAAVLAFILLLVRYFADLKNAELSTEDSSRWKVTYWLLSASFAVIIGMMVLFGLFSIQQTKSLTDLTNELYEHALAVSNAVQEANSNIISMDRYMKDVALAENTAELEAAAALVAGHQTKVVLNFEIVLDRFLGDKSRIEKAYKTFSEWQLIQNEIIDLMRQGRREEASAIITGTGHEHVILMTEQMQGLIAFARGKAAHFLRQSRDQHADYKTLMYSLLLATIFAGVGITVIIVRTTKKSDQALHASKERFRSLALELDRVVSLRTAELEAANKELEGFAHSLAHDVRAPLRAMDGFAQALLEEYVDKLGAEGRSYAERVRAGSQRMALLLDDLLELAQTARGELDRREVDLSELARKIAPERDVDFDIAPGIVAIGDEQLLEVIIVNLLDNAWKFTSKHPQAKIEFGVTNHKGKPAYYVRDDGAGFDMDYAEKLFQPFQRLHRRDEFPGTGIGLATVKRIVDRHGGEVWITAGVEQRATACFTLSTPREA